MKGFVLAGVRSGSGKTTITAGIMSALTKVGYTVAPFKAGPDYIDPMFHTLVTGNYSRNLDSFLLEEETIRHLYRKNSSGKDISIVEGVMGLFDGIGATSTKGSTAHIAKILNLPVVLIVDGEGMSNSIVPLVKGFCDYDGDVPIKGVIINNIRSKGHYELLKENLEQWTEVKVLGYLLREKDLFFPSRHLGLVNELDEPNVRKTIDFITERIVETVDLDGVLELAKEAQRVGADKGELKEDALIWKEGEESGLSMCFPSLAKKSSEGSSVRYRIGIAYDHAFNFYYRDNLDLLENLGLSLEFFSPLREKKLPDNICGLYLGGGYPEVYAGELSQNQQMMQEIRKCASAGMPIYAECGGFMYLTQSITVPTEKHGEPEGSFSQDTYPMVGIFEAECRLEKQLQNFGYVRMEPMQDNYLLKKGEEIRAHEFHFAKVVNEDRVKNCYEIKRESGAKSWLGVHQKYNVIAGFPHVHFWSNPDFAIRFVKKCMEFEEVKRS